MSLFGFGKKKEEEKSCCCGCGCESKEAAISAKGEGVIESVQVLGSGCKNCRTLYENTCAAAKNLGLSVTVKHITDMAVIAASGIMRMPALVVNGKVVSMGAVLSAPDVEKLLNRRNG